MDLFTLALGALVIVVVIAITLTLIYKKPSSASKMLVILGLRGLRVTKTGDFIKPVLDTVQELDTHDKILHIERVGCAGAENDEKRGLSCDCGVRVDLKVGFYLSVPQKEEDIIKLVSQIEVGILNDEKALTRFLGAKLNEILKDAVAQSEYEELIEDRASFKKKVMEGLTGKLSGLVLNDVAIDDIRHSHIDSHDPQNINDAKGIEKITKITAKKNAETARLNAEAETEIKKQTELAETAQKRIEQQENMTREQLKRQEAAEIDKTTRDRERLSQEAEQEKTLRDIQQNEASEKMKLESEAMLAEEAAAVTRRTKIANIDADSAAEKHEQEQQVQIAEVRGQAKIADEKAKLDTAKVIAQRVDVERETEAQQQATKDLVAEKTAERLKVERVGESEATAQAKAREREIEAETDLTVSEKKVKSQAAEAQGKTIVAEEQKKQQVAIAEGRQAELAADGLAKAEVEASQGKAEAEVLEAKGVAEAKVEEARRNVMDVAPEIRDHEIRLLEIANNLQVRLAEVESNENIQVEQARAMADSYRGADIKLVGSNADFADRFLTNTEKKEIASLQPIVGNLVKKYDGNDADLAEDLKTMLSGGEGSSSDIVATLLAQQLLGGQGLGSLLGKIAK